ncbi:MAG: F0F1 ATP synthase subunit B [Rhodospirillales bacterium]|nr:F0F1 ATP synthase subunit B [Rhodospirillales bacterium]
MWSAFAADAAHGAEHASEPFYADPTFWVLVGLILLVALIGKRAYTLVVVGLDERAARIRERIDEATRLAEEAQALLATYERKQRDAADEAEQIVTDARREADRISEQASADLERSLKRRENLALERIAQAEAAALAEVRDRGVDVAMEATRRLLIQKLTPTQSDSLIDAAINDLPHKLH